MPRQRSSSIRSASVLDLAAELRGRRSELPELLARHAAVVCELIQVEASIAALGGRFDPRHMPSPGAGRGRGRPAKAAQMDAPEGRRRRMKNDVSLPDALAKVLNGKTMSIAEAGDAVRKAGYKTTSPNFRTMVNIALLNKKRFKRTGRGQYTAQ